MSSRNKFRRQQGTKERGETGPRGKTHLGKALGTTPAKPFKMSAAAGKR